MQIEVKNWEKYNERKDRKSHFWFRFQNDFFVSNTLFGIDPLIRVVFIYLLCEQSKTSEPCFDLNIKRASTLTLIPENDFLKYIQDLVNSGVISARKRADSRELTSYSTVQTVHTDSTEQNKTVHGQVVPKDNLRTSRVKAKFLESYEKHLGRKFVGWQPKHTAMLTNWLKGVSEDEALKLVELYPQWNDPWVTKQGHSLEIFIKQSNQLNAWFCNPKNHIKKLAAGKVQEETLAREISKQTGVIDYELRTIQSNSRNGYGIRDKIPNQNNGKLSQTNSERDDRPEFVEPASEDDFSKGSFGT